MCFDETSAHGRNDFRAVVPWNFDFGVLPMRVVRTHGTEARECLRPQTEWFAGRSVNLFPFDKLRAGGSIETT